MTQFVTTEPMHELRGLQNQNDSGKLSLEVMASKLHLRTAPKMYPYSLNLGKLV